MIAHRVTLTRRHLIGRSSAKLTTGATYIPRPSGTGLCAAMTCIRCLQPRPLSALVTDQRVRGQKRCAGGCATQGAKA